jgi:hypothetical protein
MTKFKKRKSAKKRKKQTEKRILFGRAYQELREYERYKLYLSTF